MWVDFHEHKKMHSESAKKMWENEDYKNKMKIITSENLKSRWLNNEYRESQIKKISISLKKQWDLGLRDKNVVSKNLIKYNKSENKKLLTSELNKKRNSIKFMSWYNSSELHKEHNKIRSNSLKKRWSNDKDSLELKKSMTIQYNQFCFDILKNELIKLNDFVNNDKFCEIVLENEEFTKQLKLSNLKTKRNLDNFLNRKTLIKILRFYNIENYTEFLKIYNPRLLDIKKENYINKRKDWNSKNLTKNTKGQFEYKNHKVLRIENVEVKGEDVYCMTVKGLQNEDDRHNFAMFSFDLNGNNSGSGIFVRNTLEEDYFLPIRGDKSSRIESLPGASNLSEISDVEYLQNKLFSALKVPKPYLNYAESMPGGSTLSQADLRFSRTINRIQENVIIELRRIANIHLFLLGFEDDMDNFDLKLTNPSTQQELLKLETMKARLEVFKEIFTNEATSPVSYTWAMEYIMGFSKAEIKQILRQKKVEKKMFSEIDSAPEEYNATGLFKEIDDKFQKTTGNLGQADASGAGGEEMSAASGGETTDMDAGGASFGGESAFGGGNELPTSEPEATTEEPSAEPLAENLLFENEKNNDLIESLFENQNKKLNTKTQRLVDSITERLNKINEETNSDEENDSLNSGNFDSNVL
jgi:hypothetical protein